MTTYENRAHPLARVLAWIGALNCIVVPFIFAAAQPALFPLPGLYMIEIVLFGLVGFASVTGNHTADSAWHPALWAAAGGLMAFVLLGGFSIGFYLIPATIAFVIAGALAIRRQGTGAARRIAVFLGATLLQSAVMLIPFWL